MKKRILLIGGLLSLFALASCDEEAKVEYKERIVEVEKPVEVIKEVEIVKEVPIEVVKTVYIEKPVEKIVEKEVVKIEYKTVEEPIEKIIEIEKLVYVERSQVNLDGLDVVKIDDNLYEFEFTANQCYNNPSQIKKIFELNEIYISNDYTSNPSAKIVFRRGELVSKPGYIIKNILLANPRKMATPFVLDNNYDYILPSNVSDKTVAALKYEYTNINKEQIHISFNKSGVSGECYGAEVVRIIFGIRK